MLAFAGLLIAFGMWWLYFLKPVYADLDDSRTALSWGYGHHAVFASAAALSAVSNCPSTSSCDTPARPSAVGEHPVALDAVTSAALTTVVVVVVRVVRIGNRLPSKT